MRIRESGDPEVLELTSFDLRVPGRTEVVVAVEAAGLNRADCLQRRGLYPAPPGVAADIPGLEFAGTIEQVAEPATWQLGDRVMGIVAGGAMATHVLTTSRELLPVPSGMTSTDAAAIPEAFTTAYDALFRQARVGVGTTVLVHAVGSGVGTATLQLARLAGATVIGTSRSQQKLKRCAALGLNHPVHVTDGSFADTVRSVAPAGVDVVIDLVGAKYLPQNLKVVARCGTIVVVGLVGGVNAQVSLAALLAKRATVRGTVLRSRPAEEKAALANEIGALIPLFEQGLLKPVIDQVLPMEQIANAHRRLESNATFGKIVLEWTTSNVE